jgi:hypothetical protein
MESSITDTQLRFSNRTRGAAVQLLRLLAVGSARALLYKHLNELFSNENTTADPYLELIRTTSDERLAPLLEDLLSLSEVHRTSASAKNAFDLQLADLRRRAREDGWQINDNQPGWHAAEVI